MSQIVGWHPPKALGNLGNEYDEILMRCSPADVSGCGIHEISRQDGQG
jgi:hypothetical protein